MRTVIALAAVAGLLTACGYKGPLYLPKPNAKHHAPAARPVASAPLAASAPVAASAPAAEPAQNTNQDKTSP
ncbi:lipoprotein [Neisseriaceae bacterium JH1-16]|nr:lipoprotein [Neisseriaceae bacterium JH1-16]